MSSDIRLFDDGEVDLSVDDMSGSLRQREKQSYVLHLVMLFPMVVFIWDAYENMVDHFLPTQQATDGSRNFWFQLLVLAVVGVTSAVLVYFLERDWCVKTARSLSKSRRDVTTTN